MAVAQPPTGDLLLYYDKEREHPGITAYNPATSEKLELPVENKIETIRTSGDGRIAYIQDNDVWVLDVLNTPNSPTNITQTPDEQESLLNWVADGSLLQYQVGSSPGPYLVYIYDGQRVTAVDYGYHLERHWNEHGWYVSLHDEDTDRIRGYVWNGQERIDFALPTLLTEPVWQTFEWTPNNHLFITVGYEEQEYMQPIGPTDIFYWNGNDVREVDNTSDDETFMLGDWNIGGQLTLYTSQDQVQQWYVWDGVSFTADGIPDTATLTAINGPNERIYDIKWMPDGRLVLAANVDATSDSLLGQSFSCPDPCKPYQVYLWDMQTLRQILNSNMELWVSVHDNGRVALSESNGLVTWSVTVFDTNLQPVFRSQGPYSISQWSANGDLAYCNASSLLVWNGHDTTLLSSETYSKWLIAPSSWTMLCSTG